MLGAEHWNTRRANELQTNTRGMLTATVNQLKQMARHVAHDVAKCGGEEDAH